MNVLEEAIEFATKAHAGQVRKMSGIPYILHPAEVASIIATMTDDLEIMAAGMLHDTVEDCGISPDEIRSKFGPRVYALVMAETEDKMVALSPEDTWMIRKEDSLVVLRATKDLGVKIMWLADKLSNMRSFYLEYAKSGDAMWQALHQKDPAMHRWYYQSIADILKPDLGQTEAFHEYQELIYKIFGEEGDSVGTD